MEHSAAQTECGPDARALTAGAADVRVVCPPATTHNTLAPPDVCSPAGDSEVTPTLAHTFFFFFFFFFFVFVFFFLYYAILPPTSTTTTPLLPHSDMVPLQPRVPLTTLF
jgi:hypothetical protein